MSEVENAMQHMKIRKVPGLNGIPAELIKNMGQNGTKCIDIPCKQAFIVHHKRKNVGLSNKSNFRGTDWL